MQADNPPNVLKNRKGRLPDRFTQIRDTDRNTAVNSGARIGFFPEFVYWRTPTV
jgi:hypothetical protein